MCMINMKLQARASGILQSLSYRDAGHTLCVWNGFGSDLLGFGFWAFYGAEMGTVSSREMWAESRTDLCICV